MPIPKNRGASASHPMANLCALTVQRAFTKSSIRMRRRKKIRDSSSTRRIASFENLRHQGSAPDHHLGSARRRQRSELTQYERQGRRTMAEITFQKAAVIGAGTMGSGIAAHL